jgi:type I restriction enzyme S subunit
MIEWKEYRLGDFIQTNKQSIGKDYPHSRILYLDTGSITANKIDALQEFYITKAPSRAKRLVKNEDIIYSSVRPNQLHYGFITNPEKNLVVSTGFVVISCNKEKLLPKFLFYYLTQGTITEYLHSIAEASTSAYPSLKPSDIESLEILLPPLPEQRAIAEVLSSLDDKIDLLHRQNKTLEKMAETLFRQWFVEDADEDWEEVKLGNKLEILLGGTPSTKKAEFWNGNIPWINSGEINKFRILEPTKYITQLGLENSSTKLLPRGTTVLAITGATLGQVSRLEIDACANQSVIGIIGSKEFPNEYIYLWIKHNIKDIIANQTGGAQQHINSNDVKNTIILKPDKNLLDKFTSLIVPIFDKISQNIFQIRTLEKLRDTLLPKLMSGEVRVGVM